MSDYLEETRASRINEARKQGQLDEANGTGNQILQRIARYFRLTSEERRAYHAGRQAIKMERYFDQDFK